MFWPVGLRILQTTAPPPPAVSGSHLVAWPGTRAGSDTGRLPLPDLAGVAEVEAPAGVLCLASRRFCWETGTVPGRPLNVGCQRGRRPERNHEWPRHTHEIAVGEWDRLGVEGATPAQLQGR